MIYRERVHSVFATRKLSSMIYCITDSNKNYEEFIECKDEKHLAKHVIDLQKEGIVSSDFVVNRIESYMGKMNFVRIAIKSNPLYRVLYNKSFTVVEKFA
jgi:hypothetical protein